MSRKRRYRLYIDESGDHTFKKIDDPRHRFLTLQGAWFEHFSDYPAFADGMRRLKDGVFGPRHDYPVILHRNVLTSKRIKFRKKADNIAGLQLADLLAAPAKREIVGKKRYRGFGGHLVDAARKSFNCHESTGKVEGYGKVHLT